MTPDNPQQYQISGPALHATRTLLRHFCPLEKSRYEATVRNIAIMIDIATQIFRLHQQIQQLMRATTIETPAGPRVAYADKRTDELAKRIEEIRHVIRLVELTQEQMMAGPRMPDATGYGEWPVSEQARRAARMLHRHYDWVPLPRGKFQEPTEWCFAEIIDSCIDAWRANLSLPALLRDSGWQTRDFSENFRALRIALVQMERLESRAPKIAPATRPGGVPLPNYKPRVQEPTRQQREAMQPVATALERAQTVKEATQVLRKAGIISVRS